MKESARRFLGAIVTLCLLTVTLAQTDTSSESDANATDSLLISTTTTESPTTTEEQYYADIVLDDLFHFVYNNKQMLRLQQCLCNSTLSICKTTIKVPNKPMYEFEFRADVIEGERHVGEEYGNITFSCHIGDLSLLQTFVCSRRKDSYERCLKQKTCRFVHFKSEDVNGCRSKSDSLTCINLALSGYNIEFRNFSRITEFRDGACGEPTPSITTDPTTAATNLLSTTPDHQDAATKSSTLDRNCDSEKTFLIIAIIGWALLAFTLLFILFFYIQRRTSREKARQKETVSHQSKVNHNGWCGMSNISQEDDRNNAQTPCPPPEVCYEEINTNNVHQHVECPYLVRTEGNNEYISMEEKTTNNNNAKQSPTYNIIPLNTVEANTLNNSRFKYLNFPGIDEHKPVYENTS